MQKNYSRGEAYARGYFHHIKGHLTAGAIIAIVMFVLHLLSGCEPMLPDESNRETVASPLDSTKNDLDLMNGKLIRPLISHTQSLYKTILIN